MAHTAWFGQLFQEAEQLLVKHNPTMCPRGLRPDTESVPLVVPGEHGRDGTDTDGSTDRSFPTHGRSRVFCQAAGQFDSATQLFSAILSRLTG